jgi:hypothetical protein
MGGPLRRANFNKISAWPHAVASIGIARSGFGDYSLAWAFATKAGDGNRTRTISVELACHVATGLAAVLATVEHRRLLGPRTAASGWRMMTAVTPAAAS